MGFFIFLANTFCLTCINKNMENIYDDTLMPENFEEIAKAYSQSLKKKGFVFVRLEEEEFCLLLNEILIIIEKMMACLCKLQKHIDSMILEESLTEAENLLCEKFNNKKPHTFKCVVNENQSFFSLVSLENMLILKLMLLSIKSGELEICNQVITNISSVFAESFSCDGFVPAVLRN